MKIEKSFLQSKVARRIFFLFFGCVLLPLSILTVFSFSHVSTQLEDQSLARIRQAAKAHGLSIYERLLSAEGDMQIVAAMASRGSKGLDLNDSAIFFNQRVSRSFKALALLESGRLVNVYGTMTSPPKFEKNLNWTDKKTTILIEPTPGGETPVFMVTPFRGLRARKTFLVAELKTPFLWGIGHENILPPMTGLCILDPLHQVLINTFPVSDHLLQKIVFSEGSKDRRELEYRDQGKSYFVSFWPLFLKGRFNAPNLTIVLRQAKSDILAPMESFKRIFPLAMLLSLWVVLLLSAVYIRRALSPIEKLREGIGRVAQQEFATKVEVKSGDEFEELAACFNDMSNQLDHQFKNLMEVSQISQALLSSLNKTQIVTTALVRMQEFFACDRISITLIHGANALAALKYSLVAGSAHKIRDELLQLKADDHQLFSGNKRHLFLGEGDDLPSFLASPGFSEMKTYHLLPLFVENNFIGVVSLGYAQGQKEFKEDLIHARQLADQFAVALRKSTLHEEFEELSWGTLEALARTVDTKSSWTAGHSERVTELAVNIARIMKCSTREIETIQRAGMIHDIGKIGIPRAILDKPGRLTEEEFNTIKEHPLIGARILIPIKVFVDVVPIVLQHHERYDGSGYPQGLAADSISLGARILAVADVYDAMISNRPYRSGMVKERILELIKEKAGIDFDPEVVKAFMAIVS